MSTLTARKPMKRTGFKRKQPVSIYKTAALGPSMTLIEKREAEREKRLADIAKSAIANALERTANVALVSLSAPTAQVEKENPLRSEAYRRAVASLLPGGREAHHAKGRAWAKKTRNQIQESGQWPVNLPIWRE